MGHHENLWEKYIIFYKENPLIIYPKLTFPCFEEGGEEGSVTTKQSRQKES